jgi:cysteine-rich repeat protein
VTNRRHLAFTLALAVTALPALASARTCEVVLRLDDEVTLGALQFSVDYSAVAGQFLTQSEGVDCITEVADTIGNYLDDVAETDLNTSFISLDGLHGPHRLAHCFFDDEAGTAVPGNFVVQDVEATDTNGDPVADPAVSVLLPDCAPNETSTTTTTSTSTTTTTIPTVTTCELTLRINSAASIASLDWEIGYTQAFGEFSGEGGDVACTNLRPGALFSFNDLDDERRLLGGLISLSSFATPADIARCVFVPIEPDLPIKGDFSVKVRAATDSDLEFIEPVPTMVISKLECSTDTPAVCGDGEVGGSEECDDGNLVNGDGCDAGCTNGGICGDANENKAVQANDALRILQKAVGAALSCPLYVCDTNDDGGIQASDALRALKKAVGQVLVLVCPTKAG